MPPFRPQRQPRGGPALRALESVACGSSGRGKEAPAVNAGERCFSGVSDPYPLNPSVVWHVRAYFCVACSSMSAFVGL